MDTQKKPPMIPLDVADTDETREPTGEDLQYNDAEDSFELDPETADREYHHPQPYQTAAPEARMTIPLTMRKIPIRQTNTAIRKTR